MFKKDYWVYYILIFIGTIAIGGLWTSIMINNFGSNDTMWDGFEYRLYVPFVKNTILNNKTILHHIQNDASYLHNIQFIDLKLKEQPSQSRNPLYGILTDSYNQQYTCQILNDDVFDAMNITFKKILPKRPSTYEQGYFDACKDFYNGKLKAEQKEDKNGNIYFQWIK